MKCQFCKENEATIYIQETSDSNAYNINVCDDCAARHNIIENYLELKSCDEIKSKKTRKKSKKSTDKMQCSSCGYKLSDYLDTLLLSCPDCYNEFRNAVKKSVKNIHSKNKYRTDIAKEYIKTLKKEKKIRELEVELNDLVREEEYEKAAFVRDIINKEKETMFERV